jgi:hypothetical protein
MQKLDHLLILDGARHCEQSEAIQAPVIEGFNLQATQVWIASSLRSSQ